LFITRCPVSSDEEDNLDDDEEKIAVAATFGMSAVFGKPSPRGSPSKARQTAASKITSQLVSIDGSKGHFLEGRGPGDHGLPWNIKCVCTLFLHTFSEYFSH
jgi:hypothetical protein